MRSRHSWRRLRTTRSAVAFARGARTGVRMLSMRTPASRVTKSAPADPQLLTISRQLQRITGHGLVLTDTKTAGSVGQLARFSALTRATLFLAARARAMEARGNLPRKSKAPSLYKAKRDSICENSGPPDFVFRTTGLQPISAALVAATQAEVVSVFG